MDMNRGKEEKKKTNKNDQEIPLNVFHILSDQRNADRTTSRFHLNTVRMAKIKNPSDWCL